jgi:predicted small lipoprotein YifL
MSFHLITTLLCVLAICGCGAEEIVFLPPAASTTPLMWNDPSNWNLNRVPTAQDHALLPRGGVFYSVMFGDTLGSVPVRTLLLALLFFFLFFLKVFSVCFLFACGSVCFWLSFLVCLVLFNIQLTTAATLSFI